jgi:PAS domain S-box-containing protein
VREKLPPNLSGLLHETLLNTGIETGLFSNSVMAVQVKKTGFSREFMDNELLPLLNVVIWEADPDTLEFIHVSPQLAEWLDQPLTAVTHWTDALYEPDRASVIGLLQQKLGHETQFQLQYRLQVPGSNKLLWMHDRITIVHENGRCVRLCGLRLPQGNYTQKEQIEPAAPNVLEDNSHHPQPMAPLSLLSSDTLDFEATARAALRQLKPLLQFDAAVIYQKPYHEKEYLFASIGHPDEAAIKTAFFNIMAGDILLHQISQTKTPAIIDDVRQLDSWTWMPNATDIRSLLAVPLLDYQQQEMIGAFLCDSSQTAFFQNVDVDMLQALARYLSLALENAHLYPRELRRRQIAEILNQIATNLTSTLNADEVMARTVEAVGSILPDIQSCTISILEQDGTYLQMRESWVRDERYQRVLQSNGAYVADTYACRMALERQAPFVMSNIDDYSIFNANVDVAIEHRLSALLYVPLMAYQEPIGILHIHVWDHPREFSSEEISLCQNLANYAAVALENARLFAAERRQLRLSQMLQQVGALLTTSLTLDEVYEQIFDLLAEVVAYDSVSIQLLDAKSGQLYLAAGRGFIDWEAMRQFIAGLTEHSLRKIGRSPHWRVIADTHTSNEWIKDEPAGYIRSWIGAALMVKGKVIGILNVDSRVPDAYDDEMGEMVAAFANQAAVAIENASLYEETRQRAHELSVLHQVAQDTAVTLDVDELLHQTTQMITSLLYPDVLSFVMVNETTGSLRPHASSHGIPEQFYHTDIPYENSVAGYVVRTGQPYLVEDTRTDPRYFRGVAGSRSEVAVPVIVNGRVIAAINVESPEVAAFNENDVRFLVTLANQVATAIERARLYRTLHDQAQSLAQQVTARTAELQAEKERTLAILENAGEGIIFTDPQTTILYANTALEQQSGYRRSQLLGQPLALLIDGHETNSSRQEMEKAILSRRRWSGELLSRHRDGYRYDVSLTITPIQTGADLIGFVGILSDITRLKELDRLKTKFVSNVSHELRTPLTNIKTYLTLLERGNSKKRERYLQILNHETERLTRLIQDLLNLSRLETEPPPQIVKPLSLSRLLNEFYEIFLPKAKSKELRLRLLPPPNLPPVLVEEHHLAQLLSNFLANALAYIHPGDEIVMQAGQGELEGKTAVWFEIADTGPGIESEDLPRLFDRFYRGRRVQELNIPGTGLGLAICQEIINRYGGLLEVDSRPGRGTKFTVYLPAAEMPVISEK